MWPRPRCYLIPLHFVAGEGEGLSHEGQVPEHFTCKLASLLYPFIINIVAVALHFLISFLS